MIIRLAIIDHAQHRLIIDDVDESIIEKHGGEQEYIDATYKFEEEYSWDYVIQTSTLKHK